MEQETPSKQDKDLNKVLVQLIGNLYQMYFRAHTAHWNVEGWDFAALHKFFGDIYDDVFDSIDDFAEAIRQHNKKVTADFKSILPSASFADGSDAKAMIEDLIDINSKIMVILAGAREAAEEADDFGLANKVQDREATHLKWDWQLKSHLRGSNG